MDLGKVLGLIFVKCANLSGIKEPISDINKQDIKEMILTKFNKLSIEEIDYAFKMDRYSGEPVQHFQLFNAEYVAKVLNKYSNWLLKTRQEHNLKISVGQNSQGPTEEERKAIRHQFLKNVFEEVKNTGRSGDAWLLYEELEEEILVGDSVKKELYKSELAKYIEELKSTGYSKSLKTQLERLNKSSSEIVKNRCKSILVSRFIEEIGSFEEFLKQVNN